MGPGSETSASLPPSPHHSWGGAPRTGCQAPRAYCALCTLLVWFWGSSEHSFEMQGALAQHVTGAGSQVQRDNDLPDSGPRRAVKPLPEPRVHGGRRRAPALLPGTWKIRRGRAAAHPSPARRRGKQFPSRGGEGPHRPPRRAPHPPVPSASAAQERNGDAKEGRVHPPLTCHPGGPHRGSPPRLSAGRFLPTAPAPEPAGPRLPPPAPLPSRDPRGRGVT